MTIFLLYYAQIEVPSTKNYQKPRQTNISAVLDPKSVNKPPVKRRQSIAQKMMGGIGRRISGIINTGDTSGVLERKSSVCINDGSGRCDLPACLTIPPKTVKDKSDSDKQKQKPPEIIKPEKGDTKTTYSMSDKLGVLLE